MSRRDRLGCDYDAYVPDELAEWNLALAGDLVADLADADAATRELNGSGIAHRSLEGLARFLLRAEAVASSRIEGLHVGARRLLTAEQSVADGGDAADSTAVEILANIDAMDAAVLIGATRESIALDDLLGIHRMLMQSSPTPQFGGVVRSEHNWIGGSSYSPCSAAFVPPPPDDVPRLLDDLLAYVNGDDHAPLVQAAVAHAQFETIHPFADGNGRTGRALIHVILRRRGLTPNFVPPISLVLATWSTEYIEGLTPSGRSLRPTPAPTCPSVSDRSQRSDGSGRSRRRPVERARMPGATPSRSTFSMSSGALGSAESVRAPRCSCSSNTCQGFRYSRARQLPPSSGVRRRRRTMPSPGWSTSASSVSATWGDSVAGSSRPPRSSRCSRNSYAPASTGEPATETTSILNGTVLSRHDSTRLLQTSVETVPSINPRQLIAAGSLLAAAGDASVLLLSEGVSASGFALPNAPASVVDLAAAATVPVAAREVVEIDVATATVTRSVFVGADPLQLEISQDGSTLMGGHVSASKLTEVRVSDLSVARTVQLPIGQWAGDIAAVPGSPSSFAVVEDYERSTARVDGVFLVANGAIVANPDSIRFSPTAIAFAGDPSTLYGHDGSHGAR